MDRGDSFEAKLKMSGNVCQWREYERPIKLGGVTDKGISPKEAMTEEKRQKNILYCQRRARTGLTDIINSNFGLIERESMQGDRRVKFLTFTYKENMVDRSRLAHDWGLFIKRLEYAVEEKISYITIPERQKRGAFHLHSIMVSDFIPISILIKNWNKERRLGGVKPKTVENVSDLGKYLSKYLSKETTGSGGDFEKPAPGKAKRYFTSRDMKDKSGTLMLQREDLDRVKKLFDETMRGNVKEERSGTYKSDFAGQVLFNEKILFPGKMSTCLLDEFIHYAYPMMSQ